MANGSQMPVVYPKGGTKAHIRAIHDLLENHLGRREGVRVLEGGAADGDYFRFAPHVAVTGLDISAQELADDRYSERIIGDIQTYTTDKPYDLVICWYVLEHVADPHRALLNLLECTTEDGLLIIAVPNVWSLKGLMAKFTPSAIHKFLRSITLSGNGHYEPFKTYLRFSMSPANLIKQCSAYEAVYQGYSGVVIRQPLNLVYQFLIRLFRVLSFGTYRPDLSEFIFVVRKRART